MTRRIPNVLYATTLVGMLMLGYPGVSSALIIQFVATDLPDQNAGEDLWQYAYTVSNGNFLGNGRDGFSIFFDPSRYTLLQDPPPPVNGDWNVITLQPDPAIPSPGLYDALALHDTPNTSDPFTVEFVWRGAPDQPGAQPFSVYRFDDDGNLHTIETGTTPEPRVWILLGLGLAVLGLRRLCRRDIGGSGGRHHARR